MVRIVARVAPPNTGSAPGGAERPGRPGALGAPAAPGATGVLAAAPGAEAAAPAVLDDSAVAATSSTVRMVAAPLETGGEVRCVAESGPEIQLNRIGLARPNSCQQTLLSRGRGQQCVERVSVDAHEQVVRICGDRRVSPRGDVERDPQRGRPGVVLGGDAGDAKIAEDHQAGRGTKLDPRVVDRRQCAADELQRDEPSSTLPRQGRRQRDQPPGRRHERLIRREHQCLVLVAGGDSASGGVFTDLKLKDVCEIVEPDHLMPLQLDGWKRPAPVARKHRQRSARVRRLSRDFHGDDERKRARGVCDGAGSHSGYMISVGL